MAEDATPITSPAPAGSDSSPPATADPGAALTDGRVGWVRVQDPGTGGQFDVRSDRLQVHLDDGVTVVDGYPVHYGDSARDPKPRTDLAGEPAPPRAATPPSAAPEQPEPAPPSEPTDDRTPPAPAAGTTTSPNGGKQQPGSVRRTAEGGN